jgi:hypothetical protein
MKAIIIILLFKNIICLFKFFLFFYFLSREKFIYFNMKYKLTLFIFDQLNKQNDSLFKIKAIRELSGIKLSIYKFY